MKTDEDLQREVEEALAESKRTEEKRREMVSGQIKKTLYGDVIFKIKVDMPADLPHDNFIQYMHEYGNILAEAFSKGKR